MYAKYFPDEAARRPDRGAPSGGERMVMTPALRAALTELEKELARQLDSNSADGSRQNADRPRPSG